MPNRGADRSSRPHGGAAAPPVEDQSLGRNLMKPQVTQVVQNLRHALGSAAAGVTPLAARFDGALNHRCFGLLALGMLAATGYALYVYPPVQSIGCGEMGIGLNPFTGSSVEVHDGAALVVPGLHEVRRFPRRDQVYRRSTRSRSRRWPGICPRTCTARSSSPWFRQCCTKPWRDTRCARSSPASTGRSGRPWNPKSSRVPQRTASIANR
jgi:hypothetical protein